MQRRGFLARGAGPARTAMARTSGRSKAERRSSWTEANGRAVVYARSGGGCEVRVLGACTGRAGEWQHRKNRSQGGTWAPSNGLHSCPACHRWIHANPRDAAAHGWTVSRDDDPAAAAGGAATGGSMAGPRSFDVSAAQANLTLPDGDLALFLAWARHLDDAVITASAPHLRTSGLVHVRGHLLSGHSLNVYVTSDGERMRQADLRGTVLYGQVEQYQRKLAEPVPDGVL